MSQSNAIKEASISKLNLPSQTTMNFPLLHQELDSDDAREAVVKLINANMTYQNILQLRNYEKGNDVSKENVELNSSLQHHKKNAIEFFKEAERQGLKVNVEANIKISFTKG